MLLGRHKAQRAEPRAFVCWSKSDLAQKSISVDTVGGAEFVKQSSIKPFLDWPAEEFTAIEALEKGSEFADAADVAP